MNLGKVIYERVKDLPVFKSFPQKKIPDSFAVCPDMKADLRQAGGDREFRYTVSVFSATRQAASDAVDYMIRVGKEDMEAGSWCLWLHAVSLSGVLRVHRHRSFTGKVTYIFRTRKLDYAEEPMPEAEPEAEKEPAPEPKPASKTPEKKKSKQEVK